MGNCLDSSAKVDTAQSSHATSGSGVPKFSIRTDRSSAPSSRATQSFSDKSNASSEILSSPNLKALTFNELKNSTRNFHPDSFLGEGGSGYVFKGWIDEYSFSATKPGSGMAVAVKKLKPERFQGHKKWLTEVNYFGQLHHPNLVKLIGYCLEGENRLLVFQFMPKGSLENHLFKREPQPLSWEIRIKVATGAARGLCFLHEAISPIIYRDFKASNILLDADFNAKLSDYGLAKAGPTGDRTHVSTQVSGTHGYAAPEYVTKGRLTTKSDVYSFGVVLLELLSGRRVVDRIKVDNQQILVNWAIPYLRDKRRFFRIMDTKLEGRYHQKGAYTVATLALKCLSTEAKFRPKMAENYLSKVGMQKHQVDLRFFGNNNSDPESPTDSEERSESLVESVSIPALFPANESDTDGSSKSNEIPPLFFYCPNSITSFFSRARSSISENPSIRANEPTSLSILLLFPPTMSKTETINSCSEFDEAVEARFSYSIVSFFPPAKSETDNVSENDDVNPTNPSIPASARPTRRTIQTTSFRGKFWFSN